MIPVEGSRTWCEIPAVCIVESVYRLASGRRAAIERWKESFLVVIKSAMVEHLRGVPTPSERETLRIFLWELSIAFLIPYLSGSKALYHTAF